MARPTFTTVDMWTWAVSYGSKPAFAYLREKLPDFDGEKRFSVYSGHEAVSDRLWCSWFLTRQQATLWLEWNATDLMAVTAAGGAEASRLARLLAQRPNGFINRHLARSVGR